MEMLHVRIKTTRLTVKPTGQNSDVSLPESENDWLTPGQN